MSTLVMAMSTCSAGFVLSPVRPFVRQANILMAADEDTSGMGFGNSNAEAEERGRKALEALRAASNEKGYDDTLQGLSAQPEEELVEVPQEFKSQVTLGFAGFLIVGGILSFVVGGSIWEPKGFNEDGSPPAESTPAFGFVPSITPREMEQLEQAQQQQQQQQQ